MYFGLFFLPGFIFLKSYELFFPTDRNDFSKQWYDAVAYGCIYSAITYGVYQYFTNILSVFMGLVLLPALTPLLLQKVLKFDWLNRRIILPTPKAWDSVFSKRKSYWVILHLKDGRDIGGVYSIKSFTSSYPHSQDIYIEEVWRLSETGIFMEAVPGSEGLLISADEILALEFFKYEQSGGGENNDEPEGCK